MYDRPELEQVHDRFWALIRDGLGQAGLDAPIKLRHGEGALDWQDPTMLLSQTCGMPYRMGLHKRVVLVGTPNYGVEGCRPGYYRSALVVRAVDERSVLDVLSEGQIAFNMRHSQSGFAALHAHAASLGLFIDPQCETGGHLASARAVAEGRADVAALDAVSWRLMQRYDDFARDLKVIDWSRPTPGLPLVTAFPNHVPALKRAINYALQSLSFADCEALGFRALVEFHPRAYLAEAGLHG
ncbi:MAG: PhnD/SsuA/transferrin family substrate-binding protein [Pseudomonadota bacterium]